ncbi:OmpA family protein [Mesorhizobium sp.]|uniref:OmpA family protein n=1 Tax=Mesorhizobium sp. TaxID=1871066 RepID=UPI0025C41DAB|nr:OmpA family protein [Mesorhizobium sp.]
MELSTGHKVPDEEWRKLVRAKKAIEQIEQKGLTAEEAVSLAEATAAVRDNNLTADGVRKLLLADQLAADAERKLADAEKELDETTRQPKDLPPIINLSAAKGYSFEVSSAELKPAFKAKLEGAIAKQIAEIVSKYDVDVVEVIGHTDEQRLSRQSNMDFVLGRVLSGDESVSRMEPGDNAGLGLARAISVASVLKKKLGALNILPMSGGQLILPDDRLTDGAQSGDAPARWRIEIRVRKSKQKLAAEGNHEGD